jgi:hypothetical protein
VQILECMAIDVPGVAVAVDEFLLLSCEELSEGVELEGGEGEGEVELVGGAVVEAHRLENDGEDEKLQRALTCRTHLNDQNININPIPNHHH